MKPHDFWSYVDKKGPEECWLWLRSTNNSGYGNIKWEGKPDMAHRVAWELEYGSVPDGMNVLHHCDNPPCCNPGHLFLGSQHDNVVDMIRKGRNDPWRGEKHPNAVFTEEQARDIKFSTLSRQELALKYNRPIATINSIVYGNSWKHLTRNSPEVETACEQTN